MYKIGDRVEIVSEPTPHYWSKSRDRWLGEIMTVKEVWPEYPIYFMDEDGGKLPWNSSMIKGKESYI